MSSTIARIGDEGGASQLHPVMTTDQHQNDVPPVINDGRKEGRRKTSNSWFEC